jgi:hypothetical protein
VLLVQRRGETAGVAVQLVECELQLVVQEEHQRLRRGTSQHEQLRVLLLNTDLPEGGVRTVLLRGQGRRQYAPPQGVRLGNAGEDREHPHRLDR